MILRNIFSTYIMSTRNIHHNTLSSVLHPIKVSYIVNGKLVFSTRKCKLHKAVHVPLDVSLFVLMIIDGKRLNAKLQWKYVIVYVVTYWWGYYEVASRDQGLCGACNRHTCFIWHCRAIEDEWLWHCGRHNYAMVGVIWSWCQKWDTFYSLWSATCLDKISDAQSFNLLHPVCQHAFVIFTDSKSVVQFVIDLQLLSNILVLFITFERLVLITQIASMFSCL
jgi:hypothetical protein